MDNCKQLCFNFKWPSEMVVERRRRDYWHFFRHLTEYALLGVEAEGRKVKSRVRTLDQIVCAEEGIMTKDLMVLGRKPELTRDAENMSAAVALVKQKEKEEKELARQLQFQAFCERQEQLKRERELLVSHRRVLWLLGQSEELDARLKELNKSII